MLGKQTITDRLIRATTRCAHRAGEPGRGDSNSLGIREVFPEEVPFELLPERYLRVFKVGKVGQVEEVIARGASSLLRTGMRAG